MAAGLIEKRTRGLLAPLALLTAGHLLAILTVLLPFSLLANFVAWKPQIQLGASLLLIGFGICQWLRRRHTRVLARIPPAQLGLWSFAVAIAHGAGLMLVPIYLGLCGSGDSGTDHQAARTLVGSDLGMAVLVSALHSVAMVAAGGLAALLVYRWLGLRFISRLWFNLDVVWPLSLILIGTISLALSLQP